MTTLTHAPAAVATRPANRRNEAPVRLLTINQLEKLLFGVNGAKAVTVRTQTKPAMRKTNNRYYDAIHKVQEHNVFLNFNYAKAVNRQRVREQKAANFVPAARQWGERLANSCLVYHKGQYYMEAKVERSTAAQYTYRGRPIDVSVIREYLTPKSRPLNQGLEGDVIVRDFATLSVLELVLDGQRYRVRPESRTKRRREMQQASANALTQAIRQATHLS
jgi:hypothetical protein